jgi:hypothetical protein
VSYIVNKLLHTYSWNDKLILVKIWLNSANCEAIIDLKLYSQRIVEDSMPDRVV